MDGISDSDIKSLEEMPLNNFHRKLAIYAAGGLKALARSGGTGGRLLLEQMR